MSKKTITIEIEEEQPDYMKFIAFAKALGYETEEFSQSIERTLTRLKGVYKFVFCTGKEFPNVAKSFEV